MLVRLRQPIEHIVATASDFSLQITEGKVVKIEILKVVLFLLLLGGDRGLVPASLGAFPQVLGCDGRVNLLLAPRYPPLQYFGNSGLLIGLLVAMLAKVASFTKQFHSILLEKL